MKRFFYIFIFFVMVLCSKTLALEFEIVEFKEDKFDFRGMVGEPIEDANADPCAVLRVESDSENEMFLENDVYKREKKTECIYYFFISPRERYITFTSKGYSPISYKIPIQINSKKVYVVKLVTSDLPVKINVVPKDAIVIVDSIEVNASQTMKLTKGIHKIDIKRSGFKPILEQVITVDENNIYYEFYLEEESMKEETIPASQSESVTVVSQEKEVTPTQSQSSTQAYNPYKFRTTKKKIFFGFKLGTTILNGDFKESSWWGKENIWKSGIGGSGLVGYRFTDYLSMEGDFSVYVHNPNNDKNTLIDEYDDEINIYSSAIYYGIILAAKISIPVTKNIYFFLSAGGGAKFFIWTYSSEMSMYVEEPVDGLNSTAYSINIGPDLFLTENSVMYLNFGYSGHNWSKELHISGNELTENFVGNALELTLGGRLYF